jgi:LPXTG-motif cell wall-anchored protein
LTGLDDGTYRLTETAAPSGYIVSNSTVEFTVSDGVAQNFGSSTDNAWLVNNNRLTIKNTPGNPLPNTGGEGTWMYFAAGAALVLIAAIGGFVLRRRNHGKGGC